MTTSRLRMAPVALTIALMAIAGCDTTTTGADASGAPASDAAAPALQAPGGDTPATPADPAAAPGAATADKPQPGLWVATVSNGYKGDEVQFRLAADGATIQDVTFKGYWRCDGAIKRMDVEHVPDTFAVTAGAFDDVKKAPYLSWTFKGRFTSANTAEGTFRAEYDTSCDTYALKWTAQPVAP